MVVTAIINNVNDYVNGARFGLYISRLQMKSNNQKNEKQLTNTNESTTIGLKQQEITASPASMNKTRSALNKRQVYQYKYDEYDNKHDGLQQINVKTEGCITPKLNEWGLVVDWEYNNIEIIKLSLTEMWLKRK